MKRILFLAIALLAMLPTFAQSTTPGAHGKALVQPKGECKYYSMDCVIRDLTGMMPVMGVGNKLYFDEDGETVYIGSLFPAAMHCDELWAKAKFNKDRTELFIDCEDIVYIEEVIDVDGTVAERHELRMGELMTDEQGEPTGWMDHIRFNVTDDKIWLDYSKLPLRTLVLYEVMNDGTVGIAAMNYNNTLRPYTGNTTLSTPPASAQVQEYIYSGTPSLGDAFVVKGKVAVDGNDYYFDSILPQEVGAHWIKGTRSGNTITLNNDQFLGIETSYFLYYNGLSTNGSLDSSGQYKGTKTKLTFNIDENGVITQNKPESTGAFAYYQSGNQFMGSFQVRMEPYKGDVAAKPSAPYDLKLITKYFEAYGECSLSFLWDNKSTDGKYISPENLYYNFYVDDDVYTFTKEIYPYIDGNSMTDIPWGYMDGANYDLYRAGDGRDVICFREDLFNKVGVQAVYRLNGQEYRSDIVFVYFDGRQEVVPAGIASVSAPSTQGVPFDLLGRRAATQKGLFVKDGKIMLKK